MTKKKSDLFMPLVPEEKRHPAFEKIRARPDSFAARRMISEIWDDFEDRDGNFIRDFQTAGFDARIFELYLFAYFTRSGYATDVTYSRPDFIIERDSVRAVVESTTSGRPDLFDQFVVEELLEPSTEEVARKQRDEMPVRVGGPLFSKLNYKYWELPHVAGSPFVIAIEAFHDTTALFYPGGVLAKYVYGLEHFPTPA